MSEDVNRWVDTVTLSGWFMDCTTCIGRLLGRLTYQVYLQTIFICSKMHLPSNRAFQTWTKRPLKSQNSLNVYGKLPNKSENSPIPKQNLKSFLKWFKNVRFNHNQRTTSLNGPCSSYINPCYPFSIGLHLTSICVSCHVISFLNKYVLPHNHNNHNNPPALIIIIHITWQRSFNPHQHS